MVTLTVEQLKELKPCADGFKWYSGNIRTNDVAEILATLCEYNWSWCRWLFVRLLSEEQNQQLAIYSAELVLPDFESRYPSDSRPREAIEAAKLFLLGKITKEKLMEKMNAAGAAGAYAGAAGAYYAAGAAGAYAGAAGAYAAAAAAYADTAASAADCKQQIVNKVIDLLKEKKK